MPAGKKVTPSKSPTPQPRMTTRSAASPRKPAVVVRDGKLLVSDESSPASSKLSLNLVDKVAISGTPSIMTEDSESVLSGDEEEFDDEEFFEDEELEEFGDEVDEEFEEEDMLGDEDEVEDEQYSYGDEDEFDNEDADSVRSAGPSTSSSLGAPRPRKRGAKGGPEEDAWLEALEEGKGLHEVDEELKKMKDPKLMTKRQRSLLESKTQKKRQEAIRVQELETAKKIRQQERLNMDAETVERRMIKARKRRQQAEEKKEKDKKQTIDRLLKKKDKSEKSNDGNGKQNNGGSLAGAGGQSSRSKRRKLFDEPKITYITNQNGAYLILSENVSQQFELLPKNPERITSVTKSSKEQFCARDGCEERRKYCCSSNSLPVCSLACYKIVNSINVVQLAKPLDGNEEKSIV